MFPSCKQYLFRAFSSFQQRVYNLDINVRQRYTGLMRYFGSFPPELIHLLFPKYIDWHRNGKNSFDVFEVLLNCQLEAICLFYKCKSFRFYWWQFAESTKQSKVDMVVMIRYADYQSNQLTSFELEIPQLTVCWFTMSVIKEEVNPAK